MNKKQFSYSEAILEATQEEMRRDKKVFVLGQGVDDPKGTLGTTLGLDKLFGKTRCFDTPIAEESTMGFTIGAALAGLRPINVHIRMDFLLVCMNQLVNMAAKMSYMSGGQLKVPIVIRCAIGRSWGQGAQHSQALQSFFSHVPGFKVVMPSLPNDAKNCLKKSIRDNNPTIFIENRMLYGITEKKVKSFIIKKEKARVLKRGKDITIVGISYMAIESLRARDYLLHKSINAEIIDPIWINPLDIDTIVKSVKKTKKLLVVDNGWLSYGVSSEILTQVLERLNNYKIKFKRMGFFDSTCPTTKNLEIEFYPDSFKIAQTAYSMVTNKNNWKLSGPESKEISNFKGPF